MANYGKLEYISARDPEKSRTGPRLQAQNKMIIFV